MSRSKLRVLISVLLVVTLILPMLSVSANKRIPPVSFYLTILHNNDGESRLLNLGGQLEDFGGVARFKTLVDQLKVEALTAKLAPWLTKRGVIMVSSGDNFLAGAEFNVSLERGVPFFDTIAMDIIGYDAVAIGNHDFDFGPDVLADFIEGFQRTRPPYLSSNLLYDDEPRLQSLFDDGRIARSVILRAGNQKIGVIGATTPMLRFISSPRNVEILDDVAGAIMAEVDLLKSKNINKIILISHLQSVQEDLDLALMLRDIDVMVAGGGDEVLANPGDLLIPGDEGRVFGPYPLWATDSTGKSVPVVTTAGNYAYVGKLVVGFNKNGDVEEIHTSSGPVRVAGGDNPDAVREHPLVVNRVVEPLMEALEELAATVIGVSEVDLDGRRVNVRSRETNEGNLIADSLLWQTREVASSFGVPSPDVALQNGGGIRNDNVIAAGDLTELDTFSMVPFPNFVSVVEDIPRAQFKEILENAVSRVEFGDGRFAQIAGFSFSWDPTGVGQVLDADGNVTTPGTRVRNAALDDGTVLIADGSVVPGPDLTVATIDFLARGGDQYPFRGAPFTTVGFTYQQALANYIRNGLGGLITAADYPDGGEGRITRLE